MCQPFDNVLVIVQSRVMAVAEFSGLPPTCPPSPRDTSALAGVYRLLQGSSPVDWDWLSHRDRGEPFPPGADPCRFAGLSLFRDTGAAKKLKNLKDLTHAAEMAFPDTSGAHTGSSPKNHVTFWVACGHKCADYVVAVVPI
jgi:hypothetical protein